MILFLDDNPQRTKAFRSQVPSATCVEKAQEMIDLLANLDGVPEYVFLDHDLGGETFVDSSREDTGMEVVRWIEEHKPKLGEIVVHSCNSYAARVMTERLTAAGYSVEKIPFTSLLSRLRV